MSEAFRRCRLQIRQDTGRRCHVSSRDAPPPQHAKACSLVPLLQEQQTMHTLYAEWLTSRLVCRQWHSRVPSLPA